MQLIGHVASSVLAAAGLARVRRIRTCLSSVLLPAALGVATHLVADLADGALRGLMVGGQTFYALFAWPLATPYAWVVRNPHPLAFWTWAVTPLEVAVLAGIGLWLDLCDWSAWRRGPA